MLKIRLATTSDAPALAQILKDLDWYEHIRNCNFDELVNLITSKIDIALTSGLQTIVVGELDGKIEGYAMINWLPSLFQLGFEGYVTELFLNASARGHGFGSSILDYFVEEGRKRGCSRLLLANPLASESYQRNFYKKRGWQERTDVAMFKYEYKL